MPWPNGARQASRLPLYAAHGEWPEVLRVELELNLCQTLKQFDIEMPYFPCLVKPRPDINYSLNLFSHLTLLCDM